MALTIGTPFGTGKNILYSRSWIMIIMGSSDSGLAGFRYCVRFYPTGSPGGGYIFIPPDPNGFGTINVSDLIDGQISYDRYINDYGAAPALNSISSPQSEGGYFNSPCYQAVQKWTLEIAEGFDVAGVFTIDTENAETFDTYYIKGMLTARQAGDGINPGKLCPPPTSSLSSGLLTFRNFQNSPWIGQKKYANASRAMSVPTYSTHRFSIAHVNDDGNILAGCIATKYRYNLYEGETLLATQDITIDNIGGVEPPNSVQPLSKLAYAGVGLWNIENTDTSLIPAIEKPSNFPDWTHYTIQLLSNSAQASQVLVMYRNDCYVNPITLRWTNDLGGVEHFTFDGANMVMEESERVQTYDQGYFPTGTSAIYSLKLGEVAAFSSVSQSVELTTEMLTVEQRRLLATIYRSESLEIMNADGYTWPVTLADNGKGYRLRDNFAFDTFTVKVKMSSDGGNYI